VGVDAAEPPVAGYDSLPARDAMRLLRDQSLPVLERLYTWEDLHQRRTSVLRAIRRTIDRKRSG
jgi:hypothetical protein